MLAIFGSLTGSQRFDASLIVHKNFQLLSSRRPTTPISIPVGLYIDPNIQQRWRLQQLFSWGGNEGQGWPIASYPSTPPIYCNLGANRLMYACVEFPVSNVDVGR